MKLTRRIHWQMLAGAGLSLALTTGAQAGIMTFDDYTTNGQVIAANEGSIANLNVTNQSRTDLGDAPQNQPSVFHWVGNYGSLTNVAYSGSGQSGEFAFTPAAGYEVTLSAFDAATYLNRLLGNFTFVIYDAAWNSLWSETGNYQGDLGTFNPNVTSSSALYFQWGGANSTGNPWNMGIDNIVYSVSLIQQEPGGPTPVPVPATLSLILGGLALAAGLTRRRRFAAQKE